MKKPEITYSKEELSKAESFLNEDQLTFMLTPTPKQYVMKGEFPNGDPYEYVEGTYIKKVLNIMFGWNWDFEVREWKAVGKSVVVLGRLTVKGGIETVIKEQFGGFSSDADVPGADVYKAAATDALKKCASEIGIASDIYSGSEVKNITVVKTKKEKRFKETLE